MSHISKIELVINDLDALARACNALSLEFLRGQKTFKRYQGVSPCEHAIRVPKASYEVGVVQQGKGKGYGLVWDDFSAGGLVSVLGKGAGRLKQAYAVERVRTEARRKGMRLAEHRVDNTVRLVLTA